ncbi:GDP-mannose 4,6-dehydratase domain-containing protein (plasmid) [Rhizobium phaseoli]|uniref:GDP-mannose 4,6-dehydratase n=2 Tax=Rhizobium TaxID=379 RepID=A0A7W6VG18_RHIET|nr:GDP-mannose 4,6-dehydratase domain-containing protein [Rhizobium phaseoli]ARO27044.1 GDP-mannose 4,6-dehydratase domain-containing protein [Rhizobium sp. TAL182]ARQ60913.1 GDP-mannose 4,6-dehydratase domain-containing protein [Rhizobium sp. Kim5]MBB4300151.1 GDPmannose 4,6-dehydratase [Rhizobium leguminosarum]MBB4483573.1 GDPmannose 4,6-dehydratase [Rhizobium etli]PDS93971.1 GDP-mannose 4,6-dehydratase [Rhizobium sp. S9]PDT29189.1 GDP-mannose 4,6-dehydratase [Rhizobium sp. M10]
MWLNKPTSIAQARRARQLAKNSARSYDWGHAREYVEGMSRMLQQDKPDGHVLATGETTSVGQFLERAFADLNITLEWKASGVDWLRLRVRCLPC